MDKFQYHFEPEKGWMNDPNGLCYFHGEYHFFFQYNPYDTKWGPMHWGHVTTKDLIHYEEKSPALVPDAEYENEGGCFSGSSIIKDDCLYLFYTSVSKGNIQTQSMAYSDDGINFKKYHFNPIIDKKSIKDTDCNFRDPKVFAYQNEYRMIVGGFYSNNGRILEYKSLDLIHWEYMGILYEDKNYHFPIECPDLFYIDGSWVLMYSKIGNKKYSVSFLVGEYDGKKFIRKRKYNVLAGPHYYAPQTFEDNKKRRIILGWFYSWDKKLKEGSSSAGAFSIPCEIRIIDNQLKIYPLQELRHLLKTTDFTSINGLKLYISKAYVRVKSSEKDIIVYVSPKKVELLEDTKGLEVYINEGEKVIHIWGGSSMIIVDKIYRKEVVHRYDDDHITKYFTYKDFPPLQADEIVFRTPEGNKLAGMFYHYENYKKDELVIVCHGLSGGHRSYLREIERIAREGYRVLGFDYTGCFASEGKDVRGLTESLNCLDTVLTQIENGKEFSSLKLHLWGHSWGGYAVSNILNYHTKNIVSICDISGFTSLKSMMNDIFQGKKKFLQKCIYQFEKKANPRFVDSSSLNALKNATANVLVIHSSDDYLVHYDYSSKKLKENINNPHVKFLILDNKKHNPHYTMDARKYMDDTFFTYRKLIKEKKLKTFEDRKAFMADKDFVRMTTQDEEIWKVIFENMQLK